VHIGRSHDLLGAGAVLALLAITARGPLGLVRICGPRLHAVLDVSVALLLAASPLVRALRPGLAGIVVVELAAAALLRVVDADPLLDPARPAVAAETGPRPPPPNRRRRRRARPWPPSGASGAWPPVPGPGSPRPSGPRRRRPPGREPCRTAPARLAPGHPLKGRRWPTTSSTWPTNCAGRDRHRPDPPRGGFLGGLAEISQGVCFVPSFANVSAFTTGDGLVLVDTGSALVATAVHQTLRRWSPLRLDTAIYSHGHIDHVFGVAVFEEEAAARGWAGPVVVAHDALPARFDRYIFTAGYNEVINQRQFGCRVCGGPPPTGTPTAPTPTTCPGGGGPGPRAPSRPGRDRRPHLDVDPREEGPVQRGPLHLGLPNAGNPQKVQRYPREWAVALREMVALGPEVLLPGHGFPVLGPTGSPRPSPTRPTCSIPWWTRPWPS